MLTALRASTSELLKQLVQNKRYRRNARVLEMFSKAPRLQRGAEAILSSEISSIPGSNSVRETSKYLPEVSNSARKRRSSRARKHKGALSSIGEVGRSAFLEGGPSEALQPSSLRVNLDSTPGRRRRSRVSASMEGSTWSASALLERRELRLRERHLKEDRRKRWW